MNEIKKETEIVNVTNVQPPKTKTKKAPAKTVKKPASAAASKKEKKSFGSKVGDFTMKKAVPAVKTAFTAAGHGIKHAFVEMSEGLAGWIDDTSKELQKGNTDTISKTTPKNSAKKVTKKKS